MRPVWFAYKSTLTVSLAADFHFGDKVIRAAFEKFQNAGFIVDRAVLVLSHFVYLRTARVARSKCHLYHRIDYARGRGVGMG